MAGKGKRGFGSEAERKAAFANMNTPHIKELQNKSSEYTVDEKVAVDGCATFSHDIKDAGLPQRRVDKVKDTSEDLSEKSSKDKPLTHAEIDGIAVGFRKIRTNRDEKGHPLTYSVHYPSPELPEKYHWREVNTPKEAKILAALTDEDEVKEYERLSNQETSE